MQQLKLVSIFEALGEAEKTVRFSRFSAREHEVICWLASYILNIPNPNTGGLLLTECLSEVAPNVEELPIQVFTHRLLQPISALASITLVEVKAWDPFMEPIGSWYEQGVREVIFEECADLHPSHGQILRSVLVNKALNFGEIEAWEKVCSMPHPARLIEQLLHE